MNNNEINTADYESILRNLRGTLAVEGMSISENAKKNLDRIVLDGVSYTKIIAELKEKYFQR